MSHCVVYLCVVISDSFIKPGAFGAVVLVLVIQIHGHYINLAKGQYYINGIISAITTVVTQVLYRHYQLLLLATNSLHTAVTH